MSPATYTDDDAISLFDLFTGEGVEGGELADDEIVIDLFAGGGGASLGIEMATGRSPDEAVNHSATAIAIHKANHPTTHHHRSDVWEVAPEDVARGRKVGLLWASPDCTHHSKAKGGKPVSKKLRALPHVVIRYAVKVRPRVIIMENVEELLTWGPVSRKTGRPDPRRRGRSFRGLVRQLEREGYVVTWKLLRGCNYGSPTTRLRLFLVARCDGRPIVWPRPTHSRQMPEMWVASYIDWSIPMPSIFLTKDEAKALGLRVKRPLVENTLRRLGSGIGRFVLDAADPFLIEYHSPKREGDDRARSLREPLPTQDTSNRFGLVAPVLVPRYGEREGQAPRALRADQPMPVIVPTANGASLAAAFIAKHYGGVVGSTAREPLHTITGTDHNAIVETKLARADQPALIGDRREQVYAFIVAYYGNEKDGQSLREPLRTVTGNDRMALVTVHGQDWVIVDVAMRMFSARELASCQGFPPSYVLAAPVQVTDKRGRTRTRLTTDTEQKLMVGNSVNPHVAAAIVRANLGTRERAKVAA